MKPQMLPKNDLGIQQILTIINKLKDKNEVFFLNTFRWLIDKHPPFPGSLIIYDPDRNEFRFWKPKKNELKPVRWPDYRGDDFIQENSFMFSTWTPYIAVISKSDWCLKAKASQYEDREKIIGKWYDWYHRQVDAERTTYKELFSFLETKPGAVPLF